jgi:hypothetical protein
VVKTCVCMRCMYACAQHTHTKPRAYMDMGRLTFGLNLNLVPGGDGRKYQLMGCDQNFGSGLKYIHTYVICMYCICSTN